MFSHRRLSFICLNVVAVLVVAGIGMYLEGQRTNQGTSAALSSPVPEAVAKPPPTIDEDHRQYLWQIEHHGNVLSRGDDGFRAFGDALSKADRKRLARLLARDFTGEALGKSPEEVRVANDFAEVVRLRNGPSSPEPLNGEMFLDRLMQHRSLFSRPPKAQFALMSLRPMDRNNLEGQWQGSGQLRMFGEMGSGRPGEAVLHLTYKVARPTSENLQAGGWLHGATIEQIQTGRAPHFLLHDATAQRGIDASRFHDNWSKNKPRLVIQPGGVFLCDFDRDGILDLLLVDAREIVLYKGMPDGTFREVTAALGLPQTWEGNTWPSPSVCAFVDLDGDGWEDLILGGRIFRNEGGQRFVDYTQRTNLRFSRDMSAVAVADFDRDGRVDLYLTRHGASKSDSWLTGTSAQRNRGNELWRNRGGWQFENVTEQSGTAGGDRSSFTAVWLDANNDGWPDLYVVNEFGNGVLLVNRGDGTFQERLLTNAPADFGTMGVTVGDIDNDGNIDIYCANMYSKAGNRVIGNVCAGTYPDDIMAKMRSFVQGSQLWRNKGGLQFEPVGKKMQVNGVGWAYGAALVDLDNDGWLDLFATCGFISQSRTEPDG
ncbi:MAG: VCBS repeat-containing protein [Planctomycetota bacterium]|nr:MAG: VCBS repeat-containing protein [Planctomycetota bacterium]